MSKVRIGLLATLLSVLSVPSHGQTIDELTEAARLSKLRSLQASIPGGGAGAPTAAPSPIPGVMPLPAAEGPKKRRASAEPYLMAIYGIGNRLAAEIAEDGGAARYRAGEVTANGWTIASIDKRKVELKKLSKRGKVLGSKTLSFWRELTDHADDETPTKNVNRGGPPGAPFPPYPPAPAGSF